MGLAAGRILGVLFATTLLCDVSWAQAPIDLGTLPGYRVGRPRGINERGDVVGQAAPEVGPELAVLWHKRAQGRYQPEPLIPLPGFDGSDARDFAGGRVPVGYSYALVDGRASHFRAVMWRPHPAGYREPVELEPPPGFTEARAFAASLRGQVVGDTRDSTNALHAVSWRLGRDGVDACDLGIPEGFQASAALDVNSEGDVVGTASRVEIDANGIAQARSEIVVWLRPHRGSGACDPQPFILGGRDDLPFKQNPSINERGDVVARADLRNGSLIVAIHGVGWARCGSRYRMPFEMPVPEGFTDAYARDVNSRGEIVGTALVRGAGASTFTQGVVWSYRGGRWRTTLLANPAEGAGASTEQISDKGEVIGLTVAPGDGQSGALLWHVPCHGHHERQDR